jgi:hypothetical protein
MSVPFSDDSSQEWRDTTSNKFYFSRAFWTTFGILIGWTVWVLIPAMVTLVLLAIFGGVDAMMPDPPTVIPSAEYTCGPDGIDEC